MRQFIAIDLPKELTEYLFFLQSYFSKQTLVSSFHLTLKFLGDTNLTDIKDRLDKIKNPCFELELNELGAFPDKIEPKVIWVGLKDQEKLSELQKKINLVFPEFQNDFNFHPHITLARCNSKVIVPKLELKKMKFAVSEFKLYKSVLITNGPKYELIETFKLHDL